MIRIFGCLHLGQLVEDRLRLLIEAALRVDQQADDVGIVRAAPGVRHHGAVEPASGREDAGRIDEDSCELPDDRDAAHQRARGLHLVGDDRDLGADQRVDQRRFAGVGRADQRDEAAARSPVPASAIETIRLDPLARQHGGRRSLLGGALGAAEPFGRSQSGSSTVTRNSGS